MTVYTTWPVPTYLCGAVEAWRLVSSMVVLRCNNQRRHRSNWWLQFPWVDHAHVQMCKEGPKMCTTMMLAGCGASFSIGVSQLTVRYLMANTLHTQQVQMSGAWRRAWLMHDAAGHSKRIVMTRVFAHTPSAWSLT